MEETEAPLEHLNEHIEKGSESGPAWMKWVALSTAILAVLAAVASLLANHNSDEAILTQIKASDSWNYYQAKGIKAQILEAEGKVLVGNGKPRIAADDLKIATYKREQEEIKAEADKLEKESKNHIRLHQILSKSVTGFQIAIAVSAITILTRRRELWVVSLLLAGIGVFFLLSSLI